MNKQGLLIVFEGIDGSGKTTQINLLSQYLKKKSKDFEAISFPQYGKNAYAKEIEDYLNGKLGSIDKVDPFILAKAYAGDRKLAKPLIEGWLKSGKIVIANRYVSSSKAHLGANLRMGEREDFINWLDELEYQTNGMPREDLTILLSVDPKVGQKNVSVKHKADIHEGSLRHLEQAYKIYLLLARGKPNWYVIDCMDNGQMRTKEEIHQEIVRILEKIIHEN